MGIGESLVLTMLGTLAGFCLGYALGMKNS